MGLSRTSVDTSVGAATIIGLEWLRIIKGGGRLPIRCVVGALRVPELDGPVDAKLPDDGMASRGTLGAIGPPGMASDIPAYANTVHDDRLRKLLWAQLRKKWRCGG